MTVAAADGQEFGVFRGQCRKALFMSPVDDSDNIGQNATKEDGFILIYYCLCKCAVVNPATRSTGWCLLSRFDLFDPSNFSDRAKQFLNYLILVLRPIEPQLQCDLQNGRVTVGFSFGVAKFG